MFIEQSKSDSTHLTYIVVYVERVVVSEYILPCFYFILNAEIKLCSMNYSTQYYTAPTETGNLGYSCNLNEMCL